MDINFVPISYMELSFSRQMLLGAYLLCLVLFNQDSQAESHKFGILNSSSGFPQSSIRAITEDHVGFLWLGTEGGLVRYDGKNTTVFRNDPNEPTSLPENVIESLLVDNKSRLWIGTVGNGLSLFDPITQTFHSYGTKTTGDVIETLAITNSGNILIGANNGLFMISNDELLEKPLVTSSQLKNAFNIVGLWEDKEKNIWIATSHGYLFSLDSGNSLEQLGGQHASKFTGMKYTAQHGLLISAAKQGLLQVDLTKRIVTPVLESVLPKNSIIYDLTETKDGTLWIASNLGLYKWKKESEELIVIRSNPNDGHSLSQNDIRTLFSSRREMLWVGTKTKGLNSLNLQSYGFHNIPPYTSIQISLGTKTKPDESELTLQENLDDSTIWSIFKDHNQGLWIGTNKGLDYKARGETSFKIINTLGSDKNALPIYEAMAITEANGLMWIGTYDKGLIGYSPSNNDIIHYWPNADNEKHRLSGNIVRLLKYDSYRQSLWVGTKENGLNKLDFKTGEITQYKHINSDDSSLPHNSVRALYIAPDNRLWVGTGNGLSVFNDSTQTFHSLTYNSKPDGLSDEDVRAVFQSDENTLWVATGNGLNKVSINPLKVVLRLGEKQGLAESTLYTLIPDESGYLWISTLNGLSRFNPTTLEFTNYYAYHGLQDNEFNFNAWHKDADNNLYFGGINGVSYFDPAQISDSYVPAPPIILSVDAFDKKLKKHHQRSNITETLKKKDEITLASDLRRLSIEFSNVEFVATKHIRFRYRLKGLEDKWNDVGINQQIAVYTNLEKGNYVFELESVGNKDQPNPAITFPILVLPYIWEKIWFKTLIGMLGLILLWSIFIYRERVVRKQAIESERVQYYRKVVHELKTPLIHVKSILKRLDNTFNNQEDHYVSDLLHSSQRNISRSLSFIEQLHAVVKLNSKQIRKQQEFLLEELVDEAVLPFLDQNENKRIEVSPYNKEYVVRTFVESIYLILTNLISNALKYSPSNTTIYIKINAIHNDLIIECHDQGNPIPKKAEEALYLPHTRFDTSCDTDGLGLGLYIIKEVVELHNGSITLDHNQSGGNHFIVRLRDIVV